MARYTTEDLIRLHDAEVQRKAEEIKEQIEAELAHDPTAICRIRGWHRWRGIENPPTWFCSECGAVQKMKRHPYEP